MADITFRYNRAPTGELSGESLVEQTEEALSGLGQSASHAEEEAASAVQIATVAEGKSNQAVATAGQAQSTASSALTTAQSAQTSANQAAQTAQNAITTAQGASQTAQNAVYVATSAQGAAQNAVTAAQTASSNAADAASAAGASATSASAAQTAAESAQTSAAQTLAQAEQAQTAAAASAASATAAESSAQALAGGVVRFDSAQSLLDAQKAQARANIGSAENNVAPIGSYICFAGQSVPEHYLLCNGAAVSRTDYADLYAVIGDTYGAGDGSTTFNLPNADGRVLQGVSDLTQVGTSLNSGLPDIAGGVQLMYKDYTRFGRWAGNGAFNASTDQTEGSRLVPATHYYSDGAFPPRDLYFRASNYSSIYGASTKVQPPAIQSLVAIRYE